MIWNRGTRKFTVNLGEEIVSLFRGWGPGGPPTC